MTNAYENANLIKCLYVTHDAHTQPPMITKTMLQTYGPHLQQDITSTRSASLKKFPCSAYPVMHEDIAAQFIKNTQNQTKKPTSHEIFFFKTTSCEFFSKPESCKFFFKPPNHEILLPASHKPFLKPT